MSTVSELSISSLLSLPQEVLSVLAEILFGCDDEAACQLASELHAKVPFPLHPPPAGSRLFGFLPPNREEIRNREPPNPMLYTQLDPSLVADWFGPDGEFARIMPGYESRPEQIQMAAAVTEAFSSSKHLVLEAGTGVGKTMGYLVPAVLWALANKVPVIISTNTKNLQEQIFRKDLPLIAGLLRSPVRFALIKGRSNYLCLYRLEQLIGRREAELTPAEFLLLAQAIVWACQTESGDLAGFDPPPIPPDAGAPITDRICSLGDECHGRQCPYWNRCFLQKARARSLAADVVITNHFVVFNEPDAKPVALPKYAQIIFDEAHNLEAAVTDALSREVTYSATVKILNRLVRQSTSRRSATGLVPELQKWTLKENLFESILARDCFLALLHRIVRSADNLERTMRAFARALANVPPSSVTAFRIRPPDLESLAWENTIQPLQRVQDALFALLEDLRLVNDVLSPKPPPDDHSAPVYPTLSPEAQKKLFAPETDLFIGAPQTLSSPAASQPLQLALNRHWYEDGPDASIHAEFSRRLIGILEQFVELQDNLEFLTSLKDESFAYWISVHSKSFKKTAVGGLHAAPIEVAGQLVSKLFSKRDCVVLCSATMSVGGKTDFLGERLGFATLDPDSILERRLGSPFHYDKQCLAALPVFLPEQHNGETSIDAAFLSSFCELLNETVRITNGRTLVLFTSYRMMNAAAETLQHLLEDSGIEVLCQGDGRSRESITAQFRAGEKPSVLLGTDSFWEGVDLIGDALSCLVIAKLPFPSPNDPLIAARCEAIETKKGRSASFPYYSVPSALVKFRQGFGRLIRHKEDRGIFIIADTRIRKGGKNYASRFRNELPANLQEYKNPASLLADIRSFFPALKALP